MAVNSPTLEYLIGEFEKMKMQLANIAKTVSATTGLLATKNILSGVEIMAQIQKIDETHAKEEISSLVQAGFLEKKEITEGHSTVVVSVTVLDKEKGTTQVVSNYTKVDLSAYEDGDSTKSALIGKKAGEVVEVESNKKTMIVMYKLLEVYGLSDKAIRGEDSTEATTQG